MKKIYIVVENFEKNTPNSLLPLWSEIYLNIGPICFPCERWFDSTSAILEMWMDNIDSLICKRQDVVYLYFMDGNYAVRLTVMNGSANAECLSPKGTVFTEGDIDILHLGRQLISAVGKLTSFYSENKTDQRIERLNSTAKKLLHSIWKNAQ